MVEKVLIIDDEEKIRRIIYHLLTDEGYTVKTAEDGMNGYRMALRFSPRIVLMDQNMPGMNGIETMQKIKDRLSNVTVIIITAFGEVSLAVEAIKKGAYDYIEKPFEINEIRKLNEHSCGIDWPNSGIVYPVKLRNKFHGVKLFNWGGNVPHYRGCRKNVFSEPLEEVY